MCFTTSFCICPIRVTTMRTLLFIIIYTAAASAALSQITATAPDDTDTQSWNDVLVTVPLGKPVDVFTRLSLRFGNNISHLSDGWYTVGGVIKPSKHFSISPYYSYIRSRSLSGRYRLENRLSLAGTLRFPVKGFGLSHRSLYEHRIRSPRTTWHYRAMLAVEKELPKRILPRAKLFVSDEVFYDSVSRRFSRNRFTMGITKTLTRQLAVDLFYMRQNDGITRPGDLNVAGSTLKVRL